MKMVGRISFNLFNSFNFKLKIYTNRKFNFASHSNRIFKNNTRNVQFTITKRITGNEC